VFSQDPSFAAKRRSREYSTEPIWLISLYGREDRDGLRTFRNKAAVAQPHE
jgi:hypothetical protein